MNAKISLFVIFVEEIIYLLLYNYMTVPLKSANDNKLYLQIRVWIMLVEYHEYHEYHE